MFKKAMSFLMILVGCFFLSVESSVVPDLGSQEVIPPEPPVAYTTFQSGIYGRVTFNGVPQEDFEVVLWQGTGCTTPIREWRCKTGKDGWYFISLGDVADLYFFGCTTENVFYPGMGHIVRFDIEINILDYCC